MTLTTLFAMLSFSLAMSISPGPVNMMIISSGINHGVKKTMPFVSGATIGFTLLLVLIGFGLMNIINLYPFLLSFMEIAGAVFIIYMGYKIATSITYLSVQNSNKKTLKFYEGFLLQWLNPKAWIACVSGVSMFVSSDGTFLVFVIMYFIVCYLSLSFWGILGQKATRFLNTPTKLKAFNIIMGAILIFSASSLIAIKMI
ncbi:MAG TPA: LysE family translocator [Sulfurospirillum arcachonense]|nr:LysE family translocator [Sulfurospirillum arcachonense]